MKKSLKLSAFELYFTALFCACAFVFFGAFYGNHIAQKEQLQLFELTPQYLFQKILHPGGFSDYIGEFFIQFFNLPYTGAFVLTLTLFLVLTLTRQTLWKAAGKSPLIMLYFLPGLGYMLIFLDDLYSFSGITGLILALYSSVIYLNFGRPGVRIFSGVLLLVVVYWLAGAAYIVFTSLIVISEILFRIRKKGTGFGKVSFLVPALYLFLAVCIPLVARKVLFTDNLLQSYVSDSYYRISIFFPLPLKLIFASFPVLLILHNFMPVNLPKKHLIIVDTVSAAVLSGFTVLGILHYGDFTGERRMAYENLVYREKWGKIISRAEKEHPSDRISIMAVNLALAKTNSLSIKMFRFEQDKNCLFPGYLRKGMTLFFTSEPYYQLGLFNFAQMFALETIESTPDAKFPSRSFRRVAQTYIINGQYDIARKYLKPLSHTLFYGKWAKECLAAINDETKVNSDPYWASMRKLKLKYDFYYNPDQLETALKFLLVSDPENRGAFEYLMANYLLHKDFDGFLASLPIAENLKYKELPLVWQEVAAYIGTRMQELPPQLAKYRIDSNIIENIRSYAQLFSEERVDTLKIKKQFGNTFWYYLHFK